MVIALTVSACREGGGPGAAEKSPATDEEKRAQGDAILKQMSDTLKSPQTFTFSTSESIERVRRNHEKVKVNIDRQTTVLPNHRH